MLSRAAARVVGDESAHPDSETCLPTLIKLLTNVVTKPDEAKFRTVKCSNKTISVILSIAGAEDILLHAGFVKGEEVLHVPPENQEQCAASLKELQATEEALTVSHLFDVLSGLGMCLLGGCGLWTDPKERSSGSDFASHFRYNTPYSLVNPVPVFTGWSGDVRHPIVHG